MTNDWRSTVGPAVCAQNNSSEAANRLVDTRWLVVSGELLYYSKQETTDRDKVLQLSCVIRGIPVAVINNRTFSQSTNERPTDDDDPLCEAPFHFLSVSVDGAEA